MSAHLTIDRSSVAENQNSGENYGERTQRQRGRDRCSGLVLDFRESTANPKVNREPTVTPSPYGQHQMGPITGAYLNRERWRVMIGLTIRLVLFVALMSVILMGVFSVFGIILLLLVAAPILFIFALL
jgi:hypothetical protein